MKFLKYALLAGAASAVGLTGPRDTDAQKIEKLSRIATGLSKLNAGAVTKALEPYVAELKSKLALAKEGKDVAANLKAAQESIEEIGTAMQGQAERITKEDEDDKVSVLLGVLSARAHDPLARQFEVVLSSEFEHLKVTEYLKTLSESDLRDKTLVELAATWMDAHASHAPAQEIASKAHKLTQQQQMAATLTTLADKMDKNIDEQNKDFENRLKAFEMTKAKKAAEFQKKPDLLKLFNQMKHQEERKFKKSQARAVLNVKAMREAAKAVENGDETALNNAKKTLQQALSNLRARQGQFLHFMQMATWTTSAAKASDCPYCKAQCIEKCHNKGDQFSKCIVECAEAGK